VFWIVEKQAEAQKLLTESANLTKLLELYPDLRKVSGRWNKKAYCSKEVNSKVTNFDMRHNCGCCADSPLEIWPYLETEYGRVYSDPTDFRTGERVDYAYDRPYPNWQEKMKNAGIALIIIWNQKKAVSPK